jgi:drug/metabolite transporter (DMT)-like permease
MRTYLRVTGTLFGLIALGHLLRLLRHWPAEIAGWIVPAWISILGLVIAGCLTFWAVRLQRALRAS